MPLTPEIQSYVDEAKLTQTQALELSNEEQQNLLSEGVHELITSGILTVDNACHLTGNQKNLIKSEAFRGLLLNRIVTFQQVLDLGYFQIRCLESDFICELLINRGVDIQTVLERPLVIINSCNYLNELIEQGIISRGRAVRLRFSEIKRLVGFDYRGSGIPDLISAGLITLEEGLALTDNQVRNISSQTVRDFIRSERLTLEQAYQLTAEQEFALRHADIANLIMNDTLSIEQALALHPEQTLNLSVIGIRELLSQNRLTLQQALAIENRYPFTRPAICQLIIENILSFDEVLEMDARRSNEIQLLSTWEGTFSCILNRTLSVEQAIALNDEQLRALEIPALRVEFVEGRLGIEDLVVAAQRPLQPAFEIVHEDINQTPVQIVGAQGTHTASVHRTVSESATRLMNRYGKQLHEGSLEVILSNIENWIEALPSGNLRHEAAKRCFVRLTHPDYAFTDPVSGVSTRWFLALIWIAIHDESARLGLLVDAEHMFLEGLYEIQRGNNLNETGNDNGDRDNTICAGGAFNKLSEKLVAVHPDVNIEYITSETASLKFPIIVQESALAYLNARANPESVSAYLHFLNQLKNIQENGVSVIWHEIKDQVAERFFDEFGSLYRDRDDARFTDFVAMGEYVELKNFPSFQKELAESLGYQKYCSAILKESGLFSGMTRSQMPGADNEDDDEPKFSR